MKNHHHRRHRFCLLHRHVVVSICALCSILKSGEDGMVSATLWCCEESVLYSVPKWKTLVFYHHITNAANDIINIFPLPVGRLLLRWFVWSILCNFSWKQMVSRLLRIINFGLFFHQDLLKFSFWFRWNLFRLLTSIIYKKFHPATLVSLRHPAIQFDRPPLTLCNHTNICSLKYKPSNWRL